MNFPRRRFLGSSLMVLGSTLLDALTTPLWKWNRSLSIQSTQAASSESPVQFVNVAREAGLTIPNVWGGADRKRYIIEAKGSGIAFFDYDQDGWLDIYLTNGTRFGEKWAPSEEPTSHLYKNNRDGTFTDVTQKSGLARTGWQTGVCIGDYDNDGWDDLFCCFWGHNILFHNNGDGTFTDVTRKAGVYDERVRWGSGCTFLDYDRDGHLDLFVCNYIQLDPKTTGSSGEPASCQWKGIPVMCGPRGLTGDTNVLYRNNGDGTFTDVSQKAGILKPGPRYSITAVSTDFDNDGWPDIYVAVDSEPSILFRNNHDGTFTDIAVMAGCAYSENGHEQAGMGVGVADYDCDGWFDIFKTNFADDTCNLYHNNGDGTFSDVTFASGIGINNQYVAWGCGFVDYDNDGWADLIQVNGHVYPEIAGHAIGQTYKNPRLVYKNLGNGQFKDVSSSMG
ncbi:MAG TPA: VCBS repeat-containing protein, partial [Nitrospiraceae bacterium]|nr:VCBS repeat-containing protein [Nitrospiraceae bacterium]